jgi:alkanesulfonate monooxygenase SsuD/methylene tetrahydromethanopterin reductase-like flavin-dependent oxidoreductase (luciferase family)
MKIGLNLPNYDRLGNVDAMVAIGQAAEERGFASLWVTDHVLVPTKNPHPYGNFRRRGRNADTYITAIKELWTSEAPRFGRAPIAFDDVIFSPANRELPPIPVVVGGASDAALRRVATIGDGWHAFQRTPEQIAAGVALIRTMTGRPFTVDLRLPVAPGRRVAAGVDPRIAVSGSAQSMIDQILTWQEAGVDQLVLEPDATDLDSFLIDMDLLAEQVMPAVTSTSGRG